MPYRFTQKYAYKKGESNPKPIPRKQAIAIIISEKKKGTYNDKDGDRS